MRVISLQVVSQHWLSSSQAASIPKIDICPLEEHNFYQIEAPAESFIWLCLHIQMITFHTACRVLAREIYTSLVVSWVQATLGFWWARSLYINAGVTTLWDWHACKIISKLLLSQYYNLFGIECAVFSLHPSKIIAAWARWSAASGVTALCAIGARSCSSWNSFSHIVVHSKKWWCFKLLLYLPEAQHVESWHLYSMSAVESSVPRQHSDIDEQDVSNFGGA